MNWTLLAAGVAAGLGLVLGRFWCERREDDPEREAIYGQRAADSASAHAGHPHHEAPPQASATAADVQVAPAAASDTPAEDTADTQAVVSEAGDAEPTEAELVTGAASDAEAVAAPDVEIAAKRDTEASPQPETAVSSEPDTEASPQGRSDGERVEAALASGDLSVMERVLQATDDSILRNLLLNRLVAEHYRLRSEPEHRAAFYRVALVQIEEASAILNAIEATGRPRPNHIEAFKSAAIALDGDKRYDEAITICEKALLLGLEDGTKTGFEGRIARLEKRRDAE